MTGRSGEDVVVSHLVAALMAHIRQLNRDGVPVPAGLLDLAALLARARHSPPNLDGPRGGRDAPAMPPLAVDYATAAAALGVSERTISRRVASGELPVIGSSHGRRIPVAALTAYAVGEEV